VIVASVIDYANIQYKLGYIQKPLTQDQLFDMSFYNKSV
jgi:NitT/TauT family transport system substrate-binding protein